MADLTDLQSAGTTKVVGSDSSGLETNPLAVDIDGAITSNSKTLDGDGNAITSTTSNGIFKRSLDTVIADGPQVDSYQRIRVSNQQVLFANYFSNTNHPLKWTSLITGSATSAYNSTIGSNRLQTTTSASDSVIFQTRKYAIYTPGISYTVAVSGIMGPKTTNLRKRFGYFDANDGFFFEITGTDYAVTLRTSTSGSPVDTRIAQSAWNIDKLDGTGASGLTLDTTKQNLYIADFVWQGTGRIRFAVIHGGTPVYFHEILNSNINTAAWMRSPSRPARIEMVNTGTTAGTNSMDIICVDMVQEGAGDQFVPYTFASTTGTTAVSVTTARPIISIRPNTTFNGVSNRVPILPIKVDVITQQQNLLVQVILNGSLTGATFATSPTNSAAQIDTASTAISGGTVLMEGYVSGGFFNSLDLSVLGDAAVLGLNIAGSTADIVSVVVSSLAGSTNTWAGITWQEFQ